MAAATAAEAMAFVDDGATNSWIREVCRRPRFSAGLQCSRTQLGEASCTRSSSQPAFAKVGGVFTPQLGGLLLSPCAVSAGSGLALVMAVLGGAAVPSTLLLLRLPCWLRPIVTLRWHRCCSSSCGSAGRGCWTLDVAAAAVAMLAAPYCDLEMAPLLQLQLWLCWVGLLYP
jgi:hypothetical protein